MNKPKLRTKNDRLCLFVQNLKEEIIVPLKEVSVHATIAQGFSKTSVHLTYKNTLTEDPIEVIFEFPLSKKQVVAKIEATIGDRVVSTKVTEKEKAKEKYDNAIASGKAAVYAELDTKKEEE